MELDLLFWLHVELGKVGVRFLSSLADTSRCTTMLQGAKPNMGREHWVLCLLNIAQMLLNKVQHRR